MERFEQMDLFSASFEKFRIKNKIRLIELFAGIGAQSKGLEIIGADFEHWRTSEWSWQSIIAYHAIHKTEATQEEKERIAKMSKQELIDSVRGISADYTVPMTDKQLSLKGEEWLRKVYEAMLANHDYKPNVMELHASDLGIAERESYTYILTYSFPCQDLSLAGLGKGFSKIDGGEYSATSNTRSGLLWEVERILYECRDSDSLPQVLIMENVPQVCGKKQAKDWQQWLDVLQGIGYTTYVSILNAKDFGIPQNRKRCFAVSILGESGYSMPTPIPLKHRLKDFLDKGKVDEKFYLSDKLLENYKRYNERNQTNGNGFKFEPTDGDGKAHSILTRPGDRACDNFIDENPKVKVVGNYSQSGEFDQMAVLSPSGISNTVTTGNHGEPSAIDETDKVGIMIPTANSKGYEVAKDGDGCLPTWKGARGTVQKGMIPTLMTSPDTIGVVVKDGKD